MKNVVPKFESSKMNGVAVIAKAYTHIHTYTPTYTHTAELIILTVNFYLVNVCSKGNRVSSLCDQ